MFDEFEQEMQLADGQTRAGVIAVTARVELEKLGDEYSNVRLGRVIDPDTGTVVTFAQGQAGKALNEGFEALMKIVAPMMAKPPDAKQQAGDAQFLELMAIVEALPDGQLERLMVGAGCQFLSRRGRQFGALDSRSGTYYLAVGVHDGAEMLRKRVRR